MKTATKAIAIVLLLISICLQPYRHRADVQVQSTTPQVSDSKEQVSDPKEVEQAINNITSRIANDRALAKKQLLKIARQSVEARSQVVCLLIKVLEEPQFVDPNQANFAAWYDSAEVLGQLRAKEAIDILVEHLDYNDGTVGFPIGHYPALRAVVSIGDAAVPKLVQALFNNQSKRIRGNAAQALGLIGGQQAKEALESALTTESDQEVRFYIESSLKVIQM